MPTLSPASETGPQLPTGEEASRGLNEYRWLVQFLFNGTKGAVGQLEPLSFRKTDGNTASWLATLMLQIHTFPSSLQLKWELPSALFSEPLLANVGHFSLETGARQLFETWES